MKIALVAAPLAGQDPLTRFLPARLTSGEILMVVTQTWVTYLATMLADTPDYAETAAFLNDLKSVKAAMIGYDHIFYIPIYAWNIVDVTDVDEDRRVTIDYNIVKILNTCGVEAITLPEEPVWERAKFVLDMVE